MGRATDEPREREHRGGHVVVGVGEVAGGDRGEQLPGRRSDHLHLVAGAEDYQAGCLEPIDAPSRVEAQRSADPARDRPGDRDEGVGVLLLERATRLAPGDVDRAPDPTADDERGTELVRDVERQEEIAVSRAALWIATGGMVEDPDRQPLGGEPGERVDVVDHVLAADDQLAGAGGLLRGEDPAADQLRGVVAGQQTRVRVERVPAARVVVDDRAHPRSELGEELLARQSPGREEIDLVDQRFDGPCHCPSLPPRARKIPARGGWSRGAARSMLRT